MQGRYTIIWVRVLQYSITIVNCYVPNADDPTFFDSIWSRVAEIGSKYLAWGGDFNLALDCREDSETGAMPYHHRAAERLRADIVAQVMVDRGYWLHPCDREGTFYSAVHSGWLRLDYWLISRSMVPWLMGVTHMARTYSDHFPVALELRLPSALTPLTSWRLSPTTLVDDAFRNELRTKRTDFFDRNKGTVDSVAIIWEAFKVTLRGFCLAKGVGILRGLQATLDRLELKLKSLESERVEELSADVARCLRETFTEFQETTEPVLQVLFKGKCGAGGADFLHQAWSCPAVLDYWREVGEALSVMVSTPLILTPLVALLGHTEAITTDYRRYVSFTLLLDKRRVACRWARGRPPKFKDWLTDLLYGKMQLETYAELQPSSSHPKDIWAPLDVYLLQRQDPIAAVSSLGSPLGDVGLMERGKLEP
ncbi:hypothetical protein NDU88_001501 [Pleurodeles waltl]|uniref:Reverse transcriptase n=1 Tax=Pleurodeles waltl TaxID=8319 RepID=A0AAV7WMH8_PLEWA|nr:hypothetical protein NDU88_001501 [Pleurodeles waltl]